MSILLNAQNINKTYILGVGNTNHVLKDISLQVSKGDFVSVMGPSGSGKSTLLYSISGMDRVDSGSVELCGSKITEMSEVELSSFRLNKIGFIFQKHSLLKNLNILDNIVLPAFMAKKATRQEIVERAKELMALTGISELENNDITEASGGQLQRVAICRALINNPDIIYGDEPTGALNSKAATEVMDILAKLNQNGTTIVLVTHDSKVAMKTNRVLFMKDGVIVGEKYLGQYNYENAKREEELSSWLSQLGL